MADEETEYQPRHSTNGPDRTTYKPNRKVVSAAVAGLASLGAYWLFGPDADPLISSSITLVVMTVIGYLVPLAE